MSDLSEYIKGHLLIMKNFERDISLFSDVDYLMQVNAELSDYLRISRNELVLITYLSNQSFTELINELSDLVPNKAVYDKYIMPLIEGL